MSDPFLILHKVRGEPAFDIAIKMVVTDEEWWIIPTSGHRAHPYFKQPLYEIIQEDLQNPVLPADWPDHYACNDRKPTRDPSFGSMLLSKLGLGKRVERRF